MTDIQGLFMQKFFLARQPILDRNESLCAFELLFRSAINALGADVADDTHATHAAAQIMRPGKWGLPKCSAHTRDSSTWMPSSCIATQLNCCPSGKWLLDLLETVVIDDVVITRCCELKTMRFSLAPAVAALVPA